MKDLGDIYDVACGKDFTFVILANGVLYAMGQNHCGQLGLGTAACGEVSHKTPDGQRNAVSFACPDSIFFSMSRLETKALDRTPARQRAAAAPADRRRLLRRRAGARSVLRQRRNRPGRPRPRRWARRSDNTTHTHYDILRRSGRGTEKRAAHSARAMRGAKRRFVAEERGRGRAKGKRLPLT